MSSNGSGQSLSLSFWNWVAILVVASMVPTLGYLLPKIFSVLANFAQFGTYITGAFALAVSAWAALNSYKLKEFEIQRGYVAARNLVSADAQGALDQTYKLCDTLNNPKDINKDKWGEIVDEIERHARRYDRKQGQLPLLSTYFPTNEFLTIRDLYLAIEDIWIDSEKYSIKDTTGISETEATAIITSRIIGLKKALDKSAKKVVRNYQELKLNTLPDHLSFSVK